MLVMPSPLTSSTPSFWETAIGAGATDEKGTADTDTHTRRSETDRKATDATSSTTSGRAGARPDTRRGTIANLPSSQPAWSAGCAGQPPGAAACLPRAGVREFTVSRAQKDPPATPPGQDRPTRATTSSALLSVVSRHTRVPMRRWAACWVRPQSADSQWSRACWQCSQCMWRLTSAEGVGSQQQVARARRGRGAGG